MFSALFFSPGNGQKAINSRFADHGLGNGSGELLYGQGFDPYGNPYFGAGDDKPSWGFTGEQTDSNGLIFLRARYYQPEQGRFLTMDPWKGDQQRPMSLNPWLYVYGNPVILIDPSGLDPLDQKWQNEFREKHNREPEFEDVLARLFEVTYPNEWHWGAFYNADGSLNREEYRNILTSRPVSRSWEDFPQALTRLASNYNIGEKDIFVRDVGTLYAGLPTRFGTPGILLPINTFTSLARSWAGTGQVSVYIFPSGIPQEWIGTDPDANVHHWAATFVLCYFYRGIPAQLQNILRECATYDPDNFQADLELGNRAARIGNALRKNEFAEREKFPYKWGPFNRWHWQNSFEKLWNKYMRD